LDVLGLELAPFPIQEVVVVAALALGGPHAAKRGYRVMYPVSDMFALMIEADIGIVGAGTLLYETMATGLPAVAVSLTEDQAREAEFVSELGSCVHVRADDVKTKLGTALARLASTPARRTMSDVGRRHLDGGGRRRSAEAVLAVAERTAGPLFRGSSK
jgi:spore coat polysaccharide biosynthesis predicted glycosyltransferase SpsG